MNKKLVISIVVTFVLGMVLGMVVHGMILHGEYAKLSMMRSEQAAQQLMGLMAVAQLAWSIGFCWIYSRGREAARPWLGQGFRYGIAVCLLAVVPMYLIYYVVMPFPSDLVAQQIVFDSICTILLAVIVAWINR